MAAPRKRYNKPERSDERRKRGPHPDKKRKPPHPSPKGPKSAHRVKKEDGLIRLNKYIANAGVCSRREADELIAAGAIKVNGQIVTELGTKVSPGDKIQYGEQTLSTEKIRYVLLNKPKGYITTTDDPYARKTVMELVKSACRERIYPVGRLDRDTTGLLLFTNDGVLAKKLMHPRYQVKKVYHVVLDKALTKPHMDQIVKGIELDDGVIHADKLGYASPDTDKREVGLEIHSGRNRVVRRLFEELDYKVTKLDRTMFAGLTKKNLPRGRWRFLEEWEVKMLKMLS